MGLEKNKVSRFWPRVADNYFLRQGEEAGSSAHIESLGWVGFSWAPPLYQMHLFISSFF